MRRVSPVYRGLDGCGQRDDCHGNDTGECHDKNGIRTCSSVRWRSRSSATVRRVSPVCRSFDGWGQRGIAMTTTLGSAMQRSWRVGEQYGRG